MHIWPNLGLTRQGCGRLLGFPEVTSVTGGGAALGESEHEKVVGGPT